MRYCVNCSNAYEKLAAFCPECKSDQLIPDDFVESKLQQYKITLASRNDPLFGFPGEKTALVFSIAVVVLIAVILGTLSIGLFAALLFINIIAIKVSHIKTQKNMIRVSEHNFRDIYSLSKIAAFRVKIPLPEIYIMQEPDFNAYTIGIYKYGFIVINSSMINTFGPEEILFVLGHEMGHMKRYHTTWLNLLYPARAGAIKLIFAPLIQCIFNIWSVKAEYTADRAGLIACQELKPAVLCLLKLSGGANIEEEVDITRVINNRCDEKIDILNSIVEYFGNHPFIENRIKQLICFSEAMMSKCSR
jgi:Zn-dependent protease with chaperone function